MERAHVPDCRRQRLTDFAGLVASFRYKPGWSFKIGGPNHRFLCVFATTPDSQRPRMRTTQHQFEIPDGLDERGFCRWVFDRLLDCERHETGEFFEVGGFRPFYPHHQGAGDPYALVERWES